MDKKSNQNYVLIEDFDEENIKKEILGFANTFGGYLIFDKKFDPAKLSNIKTWCVSLNIKFWESYVDITRSQIYWEIESSLKLIKHTDSEYYLRIDTQVIKGLGNIVGINFNIFESLRHSDLMLVQQTPKEDVINDFKQINASLTSKWYFEDLIRRTLFVKFMHTIDIEERHQNAKLLISKIWRLHGKEEYFVDFLEFLDCYERGAHYFYKSQRDHVVHQAYVYLLGLYLCVITKNTAWVNYDGENYRDNRFTWALASTFHDIAYPFQIFSDSLNNLLKILANKTNKKESLVFSTKIENSFLQQKLSTPNKTIKDLIKNKVQYDIISIFEDYLKEGSKWSQNISFYDHGVISGIFMLKLLDNFYQKNKGKKGFDKSNFDNEIAEASVAIMVHNQRWKKPSDKNKKISINHPISFLLILADMIQEWDRYSPSKMSIPPTGLKIDYNEHTKLLSVYTIYPKGKINELNKELKQKLALNSQLKVKFKQFK